MGIFVKSFLEGQVYNTYEIILLCMLVGPIKELQRVGKTRFPLENVMLVLLQQGLFFMFCDSCFNKAFH